MKKIVFPFLALLCAVTTARAEVAFTYEAGAELNSTYLWRGCYLGAISLQPSVSVGYEGEHTFFDFNVWGNVGSSDWLFTKKNPYDPETDDQNPNTFFVPEIDITATFGVGGLSVGFTHYYYCDGSNFFSWENINKVVEHENTSCTEIFAGYDFGHLHDKAGAYFNWYTTVAGRDDNMKDSTVVRAYSSYFEVGYKHTWENAGVTLNGHIGFSPWTSSYIYGNEGFAVQCLSLRVEKEWAWDKCSLTLFAEGMMNPSRMNKENLFINKAGDLKKDQTLNGNIGLGIWF